MVRVSYGLAPVYPAAEAVDLIVTADRLGLHGCYLGDDLSMQDPWAVCAAAATRTERIRLGFSATHVLARDPALVAQSLATLDQLSAGRVEAAVGIGGVAMLEAYGIDWRDRPIARLREGLEVIRTFLDTGQLDHQGGSHRYDGLATLARPVQDRLPLSVAGMVGPRSFQLAGEVADGVHAAGCSRSYADYVVAEVARGAERVGRDPGELDLATWCITAVAEDGEAARRAAAGLVAGWVNDLPPGLFARHGIDPDEVAPISAALAAGEVARAIDLVTPELLDALAIAGTPEDCVEAIRTNLLAAGIEHAILGIADPDLLEGVAGERLTGVPAVREQLQLIRDRVVPALTGAG